MSETLLLDGVAQCLYNMILPEHILEGAGAILSSKNLIAHA